MTKKPALGKGLSALLENETTDITSQAPAQNHQPTVGSIAEVEIAKIETNPFQPRSKFEVEELNNLAQSIRELGIIQPITLRKMGYDSYQIISGERRFRASQLAGLVKIPAYVRVANDQGMLEMALVENIQRSELDAIEIGLSYQRLIDECKLTQEELSHRVGKNRSTISNYLRLLKLPAEIQEGIRANRLSMGHARAIINIEDPTAQLEVYKQIIADTLSVRKTEELAKEKKAPSSTKSAPSAKRLPLSLIDKKIKAKLSEKLKVEVKFQRSDEDKGKIVIPFESEDELQAIVELLDN